MAPPLAVFHTKPRQLAPWNPAAAETEPGFSMELEHRVWLAKFGRGHADPETYPWDHDQRGLCLPGTWLPSPLSTVGFGGGFRPGDLRPTGSSPAPERAWGPMPGDRVVAYRRDAQDVVGVWLVTGARFGGGGGEVSYSVRPLVSCVHPVALAPAGRWDADLAQAWEQTFGRSAARRGPLLSLEGAALSGVMRTVGIDPRLLCGPIEGLPECSLSNRRPGVGFRPATRLQTTLSAARRMEERALAEAVDWFLDQQQAGATDVETVGCGDQPGMHLVARSSVATEGFAEGRIHQATSVAVAGPSLDDIELCPTLVHEALDASETGRHWSLLVTLDALGDGRTLRIDAAAVAVCFDPRSGRVVNRAD
ncbi:MAG: hypothetical protein O3C27_11125 [Actinomycetota bacterium]|nr:hypothetical protein [Actinomycetota bacterium]